MTGNRNPRHRLTSISDDWRTRPPTHNPIVVPGAPILRRPGSASRPSPLRGSTSGRVWTPTPYRRWSAPSRESS